MPAAATLASAALVPCRSASAPARRSFRKPVGGQVVADGDAGEPGGATVNDIDIGGRWSPTAMLVNPAVPPGPCAGLAARKHGAGAAAVEWEAAEDNGMPIEAYLLQARDIYI